MDDSWSNQVEIYFSVVQRKVITPNDFTDLIEVEHRITKFEKRYNATAMPLAGSSPRHNLCDLLNRVNQYEQHDPTPLSRPPGS